MGFFPDLNVEVMGNIEVRNGIRGGCTGSLQLPLEIVFQEQSYSGPGRKKHSLHSSER